MKMNLAGWALVMLWIAAPAAAQLERGSLLAATADLYSPAVGLVSARQEGGESRTGAGFFIGPGRLATARSLLHGAAEAEVTLDNGRTLPVTKIVAEDPAADLVVAFVEVPAALRRGLALSRLRAIAGEEGLVIGAPTKPGADLPAHEVAPVTVGERIDVGGAEGFALRGEVSTALKGAPVLSSAGQVIGIVSGRVDQAAVSGVRLADLSDAPGLTLAEWSAGGSIEATRPAPSATGEIKASIVKRDDGTLLIDDRFVLSGEGTAANPYRLTWDLLLSAKEGYEPRHGKTTLPERVAMLDGKFVQMTGFIAFPLMVEEPTELLAMMNQWDGCCIGVPPTPYDAVEVRLDQPVRGEDRLMTYGALRGRLRIDPQLVGSWLVGLYVMDEATLTTQPLRGLGR